jgi:hypothetical protein
MESLDSEDRLMEAMGAVSHNGERGLFNTGGRFEPAGPRSRFDNFHRKQEQQQSSGEYAFVRLWD